MDNISKKRNKGKIRLNSLAWKRLYHREALSRSKTI